MVKELLPVVIALIPFLMYGLFSMRRTRFDLQKTSLIMTVCISFAVTAMTFPYFMGKNQNLLFSGSCGCPLRHTDIGMRCEQRNHGAP